MNWESKSAFFWIRLYSLVPVPGKVWLLSASLVLTAGRWTLQKCLFGWEREDFWLQAYPTRKQVSAIDVASCRYLLEKSLLYHSTEGHQIESTTYTSTKGTRKSRVQEHKTEEMHMSLLEERSLRTKGSGLLVALLGLAWLSPFAGWGSAFDSACLYFSCQAYKCSLVGLTYEGGTEKAPVDNSNYCFLYCSYGC